MELKRYIPKEVSNEAILSFIRKKHPNIEVYQQTMFDAYFDLSELSKDYSLRIREMNGNLETTLKSKTKLKNEFFERTEINEIEKICETLGMPTPSNLKKFTQLLQNLYCIKTVIKQKRTKIILNNLEISLDIVEFYKPLGKRIPPIAGAIDQKIRELRIYEAEVLDSTAKDLAINITKELYNQNLLGEICKLSKKELIEVV